MTDQDAIDMLEDAIASFRHLTPTHWATIVTPEPFSPEDFRRAVEIVASESETFEPQRLHLSPKQWEWHKWAMEELGVKTVEEVWYAVADEERFLDWLLSVGWRPDPTG